MRIVTIILIMACAACGSPAPGGDAGGPDGAAGVDSVAEALSPTDTTPELEAGAPDTPPDTPPPPDAPPELSPPQDTAPCPGCPAGFCDEDAGVCTWCDEDHPCPGAVQWCRDNECVETLCVPGKMACKDPSTAQECDPEGEAWIEEPCGEGEACAAGVCQPVICVPGETGCDGFLVQECDPAGVGWFKYACPPGFGCYVDECLPIRSNLLVIFDTSSSMWSIGFGDTVPCICPSGCSAKPFPACEDPLCPRSRLGLSKYVFGQFFNAEEIQSVNLVVTHFPMRIKYPPVLECNNLFAMGRGWFGLDIMASDFMTGDDGSHETPDGSWFEDYLYEILAVPFASSWFDPTLEQAQLWVDFDEQVGPTDEPCAAHGDCPGGFCAQDGAAKVCWYHTNPELRGLSNTPLGRAMFYAGEYYRKFVVREGRPCATDEDCLNVNYYCTAGGTCHDPYRACRPNQILLFTDGEESPATLLSDFHNPRVQAKRFRYGLCCDSPEGCFDGATCSGGLCGGYPHPNGGGGGTLYQADAPCRLQAFNGEPIQITTHVIDLSAGGGGAGTNKQIADDGGGVYYNAVGLDPDDILAQMLLLIDVKENIMQCIPEQ